MPLVLPPLKAFAVSRPCSTSIHAMSRAVSSNTIDAGLCPQALAAALRQVPPPTFLTPARIASLFAPLSNRPCWPLVAISAVTAGAELSTTLLLSASGAPSKGSAFISFWPTAANIYLSNLMLILPTTTTADLTKACTAKHLPTSTTSASHSVIIVLLNKPR